MLPMLKCMRKPHCYLCADKEGNPRIGHFPRTTRCTVFREAAPKRMPWKATRRAKHANLEECQGPANCAYRQWPSPWSRWRGVRARKPKPAAREVQSRKAVPRAVICGTELFFLCGCWIVIDSRHLIRFGPNNVEINNKLYSSYNYYILLLYMIIPT